MFEFLFFVTAVYMAYVAYEAYQAVGRAERGEPVFKPTPAAKPVSAPKPAAAAVKTDARQPRSPEKRLRQHRPSRLPHPPRPQSRSSWPMNCGTRQPAKSRPFRPITVSPRNGSRTRW